MTSLSQQSNASMILAAITGAPILFAFLLGSLPVLVPVLFYRWIAQRLKPIARITPAFATATTA